MKNLTLIILITIHTSLFTLHSFSQSCLPEGITFTTQTQIDSFQINYPGCNEIEGSVAFGSMSGTDITNLNGLSVLTSISGDVKIYNNHNLQNLTGLDNLAIIGGDIEIGITSGPSGGYLGNDSLASISSLDLLEAVSGDLRITGNPLLTSLTGLHNITNIQGDLSIGADSSLNNLSGLGSLTNIAGGFYMGVNQSIENLIGLENLISIEGDLRIGGLGYFDSPDKTKILNNPSLTSLEGLNNLTGIGGDLYLGGLDVLVNLDGLENLNSIGTQLQILTNSSLNSLTGLQNLTSTGVLRIIGNNNLTSLSGLDNINSETIFSLEIVSNDLLTNCEVQSICDYLVAPNGEVSIYVNAPGCNSPEEVIDACDTAVIVQEVNAHIKFSIAPNPLNSNTIISYTLDISSTVELTILDLSGRSIVSLVNEFQQQGEQRVIYNSEGLKPGVYFCIIKTNEGIQTKKLIKL